MLRDRSSALVLSDSPSSSSSMLHHRASLLPTLLQPATNTRIYSNAPSAEARRTVPLPKEDLVAYIASGNKPRTNWRCERIFGGVCFSRLRDIIGTNGIP